MPKNKGKNKKEESDSGTEHAPQANEEWKTVLTKKQKQKLNKQESDTDTPRHQKAEAALSPTKRRAAKSNLTFENDEELVDLLAKVVANAHHRKIPVSDLVKRVKEIANIDWAEDLQTRFGKPVNFLAKNRDTFHLVGDKVSLTDDLDQDPAPKKQKAQQKKKKQQNKKKRRGSSSEGTSDEDKEDDESEKEEESGSSSGLHIGLVFGFLVVAGAVAAVALNEDLRESVTRLLGGEA